MCRFIVGVFFLLNGFNVLAETLEWDQLSEEEQTYFPRGCAELIKKGEYENFRTIVLNNPNLVFATIDDRAEVIKGWLPGATLLHLAAYLGRTREAKLLLRYYQAPIDATNKRGETPLHLAMFGGSENGMVDLLLVGGADAYKIEKSRSKTSLGLALAMGNRPAVRSLIIYELFRLTATPDPDETNEVWVQARDMLMKATFGKEALPGSDEKECGQHKRSIANGGIEAGCGYLKARVALILDTYAFADKELVSDSVRRVPQEIILKTIKKYPECLLNCNYFSQLPLHLFAKYGRYDLVEIALCFEAGGLLEDVSMLLPDKPELLQQLRKHRPKLLEQLLKDRPELLHRKDFYGYTPFFYVVKNQDEQSFRVMAQYFLSKLYFGTALKRPEVQAATATKILKFLKPQDMDSSGNNKRKRRAVENFSILFQ